MDDRLNWIISVDDHLIEPPDLWVDRVAAADREFAPHVQRIDGIDTWIYGDYRSRIIGNVSCAGKSPDDINLDPVNYADMRPGYYDSKARLADMDQDGVLAQLCFPTFTRFCGQVFNESPDKDRALRFVKAYNDWHIDEWAGAAPGRFMSLILLPFWDAQLAAREIERCAAKGATAIAFSENPYALGLPSIHDKDRYWDPVFAAANEAQMPICTHLGSSSKVPVSSPDAPMAVPAIMANMNLAMPTVDWLYSGIFQRYPSLKLVLSEGGIGWIPFVLERAQHVSTVYRYLAKADYTADGGTITQTSTTPSGNFPDDPTALFRDHIFGCFIEDEFGARNIDAVGMDNVMIETDYPHSDSCWPNSIAVAHGALSGRTDDEIFKILQGNAMRVFNFTPASYPSAA